MTSIIKVNNIQNSSGTAAVTIDGSSNITFPQNATVSGNTTISGTTTATGKITSTAGITFGSDTADANVLHDYEEGSWTATLTGSSTNPSSAVTVTGNYIKIGLLVYVTAAFANVNTSGAAGEIRITGLPYTPSPGNQMTGNVTFHSMHLSNTTDRISNISPFFTSGYIAFYGSSSGNAWSGIQHTSGGYNGGYLYFTGSYLTL